MQEKGFDLIGLVMAGRLATWPLLVGSILGFAVVIDRLWALRGTERAVARTGGMLTREVAEGREPGDPASRAGGAAGIVLVVPQQAAGVFGYVLRPGVFVDDPAFGGSRLFVGSGAIAKLFTSPLSELKAGAVGATVNVKAILDVVPSPFPARNVVAILPGSDPKLKNQYVAVGAHSDPDWSHPFG